METHPPSLKLPLCFPFSLRVHLPHLVIRAGTFIVVTALYYQGLTKDAKHGKEGKGKDDSGSSKLGKEEGKDNGKSKEKEVLTSGSGNGHGTRKAPDPDSAAADKAAAS